MAAGRTKELSLRPKLPSHLASGSLIVVRRHFCRLEPTLLVRLLSSLERRAAAVSSPFLAHNSTAVINTSTDTVPSINNNIPVWPKIWCSGRRVSHDLFSMVPAPCCCRVIVVNHRKWDNECDIRGDSAYIGYTVVTVVFPFLPPSVKPHVSLNYTRKI